MGKFGMETPSKSATASYCSSLRCLGSKQQTSEKYHIYMYQLYVTLTNKKNCVESKLDRFANRNGSKYFCPRSMQTSAHKQCIDINAATPKCFE